jgi:DNA-binding winged helix-turn-helix (wHTH) protein/tetratricopeptide (TPR) repeat protein
MVFNFGPFELDVSTRELKRDGRSIALQPRMFGVLRYLIEHRERVVTKQELLDALWGGYQLNAVAVPWTINRLRKALGTAQHEHDATYIETVRGHGYRFVGELQARVATSVLAPVAPETAPPAAARRVFVGRTSVMAQLSQLLSTARGGEGTLCLLAGEAGIGKTSCALELAARAEQRGVPVWLGRCFEHGAAPALWPFVQVLRAAFDDVSVSEAERSEARQLLDAIEHQPPSAPPSAAIPNDLLNGERFWLLDRLCRWLCRSARAQPRLIVIDDLQAADETSLQALSLIAPQLAQARVLLLATVRIECGHTQTRTRAASALRLRPSVQTRLSGLTPAEAHEYLQHAMGAELAERWSAGLWESSRGNPLFLGELSRVLAEQAEHGPVATNEPLPLPTALSDAIAARFADQPAELRHLLEVASVFGERSDVALLQRASGLPEPAVLSGLRAACEAGLLVQQPGAEAYTFVHPLLREVLYAAIPVDVRASLHGSVGNALEALRVVDPTWRELAYHFQKAPLAEYCARAARYGRMAGDAALQAFAYEEAVQCYGWAIDAHVYAAPGDIAGACELLLLRAGALTSSSNEREAQRACKRAIDLAWSEGLPHILVAAARQLRPSVWAAYIPDPVAVSALEHALTLLPESEVALRARAHALLAVLPPYASRLETSRAMSAQAIALAAQQDDKLLQLEAARSQLFTLCEPSAIDAQLRVSDSIVDNSDESTWRFCADALFARYHALMQRGDSAAAELALARYAELSQSRRLRIGAWHVERLRAQRALHAGHFDEAEQRFDALAEAARSASFAHGEAFYRAQRAVLARERTGERRTPIPANAVTGPHWLEQLPSMRARRVRYALELGEISAAKHELHALADARFAAVTSDPFNLSILVQLVAPVIELDERAHAHTLSALLEPHCDLIALSPFTFSYGSVSHYIGTLSAYLGRRREAREHLERAIRINARTGHELDRLRSCLALAEQLSEQRGSSERARALTQQTLEAAERLGSAPLEHRALRLLANMPAPRRRNLRAAP